MSPGERAKLAAAERAAREARAIAELQSLRDRLREIEGGIGSAEEAQALREREDMLMAVLLLSEF